jgi:signal transduction histidine kinase
VQLAGAEHKNADLKIEAFVQPETLRLQVDVAQMEMVLLNLVKNAREALGKNGIGDDSSNVGSGEYGPRITLRAGADSKGKVFIEVEDNGPGIAPELLEEVFIPFFTTKPTGTGVGLSISRQIMQLHGGDIRLSSVPGSGARFVLEF